MSRKYTFEEIASDFELWGTYWDPDGVLSREEFEAGSVEDRVKDIESVQVNGYEYYDDYDDED